MKNIDINQLEINKLDVECLRENRKEFIKNNILIIKPQQTLRDKKRNVFTEEVYKIALVCRKEEIKCNNISKQYKNDTKQKKTQKTIIQIGYKFLITMQKINDWRFCIWNLIKIQDDDDYSIIDKICLCVKDEDEIRYQYLIKKPDKNDLEILGDFEYSNIMQSFHKNIEEYNTGRKYNY